MAYKTPGVYVEEITTFPPSVVPVETAIPAFIGYTEKAIDAGGKSLKMVPTRIKSLLEFETYFGGDFVPNTYRVTLNTTTKQVTAIAPRNASDQERRYYLYNCLRHFYANGGGSCYIVSVGFYPEAPALGDIATPAGLRGGLSRLARFDEPTLLLFPDGVSLSSSELKSLRDDALEQCEKLQDRFVIMDLQQGSQPVQDFRDNVGQQNLKYGAAYYPWVQTIYRPTVHLRNLRFVNTEDPPAPITDTILNRWTDKPDDSQTLMNATRNADANVKTVIDVVIYLMGNPPWLTLNRNNFPDLIKHFADLLALLRQTLATADDATIRQQFGNLLLLPRAIALAFPALSATTLPPMWPEELKQAVSNFRQSKELKQAVSNLSKDTRLIGAIVSLVALEKNPRIMDLVATGRVVGGVESDYAALNNTVWIAPNTNVTAITANSDSFPENLRARALNAAAALQTPFNTLAAAILSVFDAAEFLANEAEQRLLTQHSVIRDVVEQVKRTMSLLPVSGAIAGVYAAVDRTRGVWKAPANVSLADVMGPAAKINDAGQEDLNVHTTGKSINAIRAFTGKGTLVWGARTLAGNDNEWRYIPVRRFFNMAEESIKKATEPFVFEPNDANTWVRVRAMIENFLTIQWRAGALAGAKPEQAFYVKVGLGETMTAQDILEGRMIVEIGMAVVRPAEFIILKFAHKMQVS